MNEVEQGRGVWGLFLVFPVVQKRETFGTNGGGKKKEPRGFEKASRKPATKAKKKQKP